MPRKMLRFFKETILKSCFYLFRIFRVKSLKIVAVSFYGRGYGDSGKYIFDELHSRNKRFDLVWLAKDPTKANVPKYVRVVKYNSLRAIYELATAKVWIDNCRKRLYTKKRKSQFYLQTWHSNLRLKKIEMDAEKYLPESYMDMAKHDSKLIDAIVVGCDFSYNTMRNSFWYNGPIYKTGTPRCDELFNVSDKSIKEVRKSLKISNSCKIFLYAPTFRKNRNVDLDGIESFVRTLKKEYSNEFKLLIRFHPGSNQSVEETECIKDATKYPNMQDLINVSDILITDYSGSMFDAAISRKPCILYTPDYEEYLRNERELYFNFDELPFERASTLTELADIIMKFDKKKYDKRVNSFLEEVGCYEKGESAKKVVDLLEKEVWGKND